MAERLPKVGDHVILRFVGEVWEVSDMRKFLGTEQEISEVWGEDNAFQIKNGNGWVWEPISIERWLDDVADPPDDSELRDFIGF